MKFRSFTLWLLAVFAFVFVVGCPGPDEDDDDIIPCDGFTIQGAAALDTTHWLYVALCHSDSGLQNIPSSWNMSLKFESDSSFIAMNGSHMDQGDYKVIQLLMGEYEIMQFIVGVPYSGNYEPRNEAYDWLLRGAYFLKINTDSLILYSKTDSTESQLLYKATGR